MKLFARSKIRLSGISMRQIHRDCKNQQGFTLIELLMVVTIIAVLITVTGPYMGRYFDTVRVGHCVSEMGTLARQIEAYALDHGNYPATLDDLNIQVPVDAWDRPYVYLPRGVDPPAERVNPWTATALNPNTYDLYSMGKDALTSPEVGQPGAADDIVRAVDGSYYGLFSKF